MLNHRTVMRGLRTHSVLAGGALLEAQTPHITSLGRASRERVAGRNNGAAIRAGSAGQEGGNFASTSSAILNPAAIENPTWTDAITERCRSM